LLKAIRTDFPDTAVVIVTAYGTIETAVEAIKCGAYDYITKPIHPDELRALVNRVLERHRLIEEVRVLRSTIDRKYGFENIIGTSSALLQVLDAASSVADTEATVLILGETGTGKELLAKAIHFNSPRRDRPFVIISCGSIPRELLESELFGHIKGSFTGAFTHKKGKVEIAEGGTVFLDEIGEMPLELQVRVLRLVQEHEIDKIGASNSQKVNVRIIAATHRNLEDRVAEGLFREDLFYRLAVIPITLPALRDRKEDIPLLVEAFFARSKNKHNRPAMFLQPAVMSRFENHRWPGNIRELENVVERMVLLSRSDECQCRAWRTFCAIRVFQPDRVPSKCPRIQSRQRA
jgi:DNA-binding NtrC family response regulator